MSRIARKQSESGIYHIMIRGNEKKEIFHDERDRRKYLDILTRMKDKDKYLIYAYCLMRNHVHLLLHEGEEPLQRSMKRIEISYVYYFNKKYERVGHLFQDRFRSEGIDGDPYLLSVTRYIHNNPVKAGIVTTPEDYKWSSCNEYYNMGSKNLVDKDYLLSIFSKDSSEALKLFRNFTNNANNDDYLDTEDNISSDRIDNYNDYESMIIGILSKYGFSLDSFRNCKDLAYRNNILKVLKQGINISLRELSEITGVSKDIIYRA